MTGELTCLLGIGPWRRRQGRGLLLNITLLFSDGFARLTSMQGLHDLAAYFFSPPAVRRAFLRRVILWN